MPNIRWLPVTGLPSLKFVLMWRTEAENKFIHALANSVRDLGPYAFGG